MYANDDDFLSHKKVYQTEIVAYFLQLGAFCWLDDSHVIVTLGDIRRHKDENCIILKTVGLSAVLFTHFRIPACAQWSLILVSPL